MAKISIIVPVYNSVEYIERCLDSINNQTYQNYEVILVDDGSDDGSGQICDEYAFKNNRIRVIHQDNKGQANARNVGLDNIDGDYVAFVDSDDWLDENAYNIVNSIIEEQAPDIVCFDVAMTNENGDKIYHNVNNKELKQMLPRDMVEMIIRDEGVRSYPVNKICRREMFGQLRFPEGQVFEDVDIIYQPFFEAEKVCYLKQDLYFYRLRKSSTTHERDVSKIVRNLIYIYNAKKKRAALVEQHFLDMSELLVNDIFVSALDVYDRIRAYENIQLEDYNVNEKTIENYKNEAYDYILDNYNIALGNNRDLFWSLYYHILVNHKRIYDAIVLKIKKMLWILHRVYKYYIKRW